VTFVSRVAVVKGDDRYSTVSKALQLIREDLSPARIRDRRVLIKPNFVSSSVELAATHVDATRAVIDFIQPFKPRRITVAEGSPSDTKEAFQRFDYRRLEREYDNVELVDLNDDSHTTIAFATLEGTRKEVRLSKTVKECDYRISVARAKTHDHVVCTLTLKNLLGCVPRGWHVWAHGASTEPLTPRDTALRSNWLLAKNLVTLADAVKPDLGVIDGFVGMEGDGPVSGTPVDLKVAVASSDFVAADSVMARIMGFDPLEISYIHLANKIGLGKAEPESMSILGENPDRVRMRFKPHSNYRETQIGWRKYAVGAKSRV
jgi:uncharacterized protein (DUF362 family)